MNILDLYKVINAILDENIPTEKLEDFLDSERLRIHENVIVKIKGEYDPNVEHPYSLFSSKDNINLALDCSGPNCTVEKADIDPTLLASQRIKLATEGYNFAGIYHSHPPRWKSDHNYTLPTNFKMCPSVPSAVDVIACFSPLIPNFDLMLIGHKPKNSPFIMRAFTPVFFNREYFIHPSSYHIKGRHHGTSNQTSRLEKFLEKRMAIVCPPESLVRCGFIEINYDVVSGT